MFSTKMKLSCVLLVTLAVSLSLSTNAAKTERVQTSMNSIKTYMNFPKEIDPAHILSMADLELSNALASTLVTFDQERQISAALAESWEIISPKTVQFKLRRNLTWSDGTPIVAKDFKLSLERAKAVYPDDLKSLFDSIVSVEATSPNTLRIVTTTEVTKSGVLLKLAEPMYGLLSIHAGKIDLSKTSGPFSIAAHSDSEVTLKANTRWYSYDEKMPQKVVIRKEPKDVDLVTYFLTDKWANLVSGSTLMKASTRQSIESSGLKTWQRPLDKLFGFYPSKSFLKHEGAKFTKFLGTKLNIESMLVGFSGYTLAKQFFPRGYELWSSSSPQISTPEPLAKVSKLKVIMPLTVYTASLKEKISDAIGKAVGIKCEVELIPVSSLTERMQLSDYDLLATGLAVADPNFEGAMSFFIEREPAFIASTAAPMDFSTQLRLARALPTSKERADEMKRIILSAQESGHVLPLFHFSSLAITKPEIDLSQVPNSDETVLFSKVRMK